MSIAVVIIASEKRRETIFPSVLESVREQEPDEIVVAADFPCEAQGVRSLLVPAMVKTTVDALVKRDVGWIATISNHICYLCDDHRIAPGFVDTFRRRYDERDGWDILVPSRFCERSGVRYLLEVGQKQHYAGGHCAIYKRWCGYAQPWSATFHHPNWDVLHSLQLRDKGARLLYATNDLAVEDLEPEAQPWQMTAEQQQRHDAWHQSIERGPR